MNDALNQPLLQAIRATPDDDAPRLVYADWLQQQGQAERAQLVRTQLQRAQLPRWDPQHLRLELAERAILADHEQRWRSELPALEDVVWGSYRRGFVDRVGFRRDVSELAEDLQVAAEHLPLTGIAVCWPRLSDAPPLERLPGVRRLIVYGAMMREEDLQWLLDAPLLTALHTLDLVDSGMGDRALGQLLASDRLAGLHTLRVPLSRAGDPVVSRLVNATGLTGLTALDLSVATSDELGSGGRDEPTLSGRGVEALAQWPGLLQLRSLDLSGHQIEAEGLAALLASPLIANLQQLCVRNITFGTLRGAFAGANPALRLQVLNISENRDLDLATAEEMAQATCLSELKVLEMNHVFEWNGAEPFRRLVQAPWFDSLRVLEASDAPALIDPLPARRPANLRTLRVAESYQDFEADSFQRLANAPGLDSLLEIDLTESYVGDEVCDCFARATGLQGLLCLDLYDADLSDEAVERLVGSPLGKRLLRLEIGDAHDRLPRPARRSANGRSSAHPLLWL